MHLNKMAMDEKSNNTLYTKVDFYKLHKYGVGFNENMFFPLEVFGNKLQY